MHLTPNLLLGLILIVAWRWEWVGAALFSALGVFDLVMARERVPPVAFVFISGPLILVGGLFLVGWIKRDQIRA